MATYVSSKQSAALDLDHFATKKAKPQPQLQALPENENYKKTQAARVPYVKYGVIVACIFAVVIAILSGYTQMMELTSQNDRLRTQLDGLKSEENALNAKKEQLYNLTYVEEYAKNTLGMVKLDKSDIEYVELSNPERMTLEQSEESSGSFFGNVLKSFNVILEYLN